MLKFNPKAFIASAIALAAAAVTLVAASADFAAEPIFRSSASAPAMRIETADVPLVFYTNLDRSLWTADASSRTSDGTDAVYGPQKAFDDDLNSHWATAWTGAAGGFNGHDQVFHIDLGETVDFEGFDYTTRQAGSAYDVLGQYEIYVTDEALPREQSSATELLHIYTFDGNTPIATGTMLATRDVQRVIFDAPVSGRHFYIRAFNALNATGGSSNAFSISNLNLLKSEAIESQFSAGAKRIPTAAASELIDGHYYLIQDMHSDRGCIRRANGTSISGTPRSQMTSIIPPAYVWKAEASGEGFKFLNSATQTYITNSGNTISLNAEGAVYTATATEADATHFNVANGSTYWDGNADYSMAGWSSPGHDICFYDVSSWLHPCSSDLTVDDVNLFGSSALAEYKLLANRIEQGALLRYVSQISSDGTQDSVEGSIANLIDNNTAAASFYHSTWHVATDDYHRLIFTFENPNECTNFDYYYHVRNGNNRPTSIFVYGSTDGETWTKEAELTPVGTDAEATLNFTVNAVYDHLKFEVRATNTGATVSDDPTHPFFTYSEIQLYEHDYVPSDEIATQVQDIRNAINALENAETFDALLAATLKESVSGRFRTPFSSVNLAQYPAVKFYNYSGRGSAHYMAAGTDKFIGTSNRTAASTDFKLIPASEDNPDQYYIYCVSTDKSYGGITEASQAFPAESWNGDPVVFTMHQGLYGTLGFIQSKYGANSAAYIHLDGYSNCVSWNFSSDSPDCSSWYMIRADSDLDLAERNIAHASALADAYAEATDLYDDIVAFELDGKDELKAAIDIAAVATVGMTNSDYVAIIESLNAAIATVKNNDDALFAIYKHNLGEELKRIHGSVFQQHATPGYVPAGVDYVDQLFAVYNKALSEYESIDAAEADIDAAIVVAQEKTDELIAVDRTADFSTGALYRITNTHYGNQLYYKEGHIQVESTGHIAYEGDPNDDCMLWGLVEYDGSYYLYNAGAAAMTYVQDCANGTGSGDVWGTAWFLEGDTPVSVTINEAANSDYSFPNVDIKGTVGGTIYGMSLYNNYKSPVLTFHNTDIKFAPMQFEFVKEADQELVESMIQEYTTPDMETLVAELNRVHGSTTAYNTPGYVPVGVDYVDALLAAYAQKDSADPFTLTSAVKAAIAAVPEDFAADRTADYSPEALYRISHNNSAAYLYYNAATPDYLYTTAKVAYSGELTDDCMLWGIVDGYLYNAEVKRFAFVPVKSNNNYWLFSGFADATMRPVVLTINAASAGFPAVNLVGDGTVNMHVSTGYSCPIIMWTNPTAMQFEFVKAVDDEVLHTTVETLNSSFLSDADIVTMLDRFRANIAADSDWAIGHNQEANYETLRTALTEARVNDSPAAKFGLVDKAMTLFREGIELPKAGRVYTIESVHASHNQNVYIYNNAGTLAVDANVTSTRDKLPGTYKWYCQKNESGHFIFSNYIDTPIAETTPAAALYSVDDTDAAEGTEEGSGKYNRTETKLAINGYSDGQLYVEPDTRPEQHGFVNLKSATFSGTTYLVTKRDLTNNRNTFDRTSNLNADADYPGTFRLVLVGEGKGNATTGLSEITADGANDVWFDLQGRRVVNPTHGLFINTRGEKVFINK